MLCVRLRQRKTTPNAWDSVMCVSVKHVSVSFWYVQVKLRNVLRIRFIAYVDSYTHDVETLTEPLPSQSPFPHRAPSWPVCLIRVKSVHCRAGFDSRCNCSKNSDQLVIIVRLHHRNHAHHTWYRSCLLVHGIVIVTSLSFWFLDDLKEILTFLFESCSILCVWPSIIINQAPWYRGAGASVQRSRHLGTGEQAPRQKGAGRPVKRSRYSISRTVNG